MDSFNYKITNEALQNIAEIEGLRSRINASYILPEREIAMRYRATVEATHSSTSIEGNPLNIKQVNAVLSEKTSLTRHRYAEIEVRNYKKALDFINHQAKNFNHFTAESILRIHSIITNDLLGEERSGHWRWNPVYIEDQNNNKLYDGAPATEIADRISNLLNWLNNEGKTVHPVIAAAVLHFELVSIHPFADGNGRTTRIATMLYLAIRKYDFRQALVLDSYYLSDKNEYYNALQRQGHNYHERHTSDLTPWINYFIQGFLSSAKVLMAEVSMLTTIVTTPKVEKLSRAEIDILDYVEQFGEISISEAEQVIQEESRRNVQRHLKSLVDAGYLKTTGATHQLRYIKNQ